MLVADVDRREAAVAGDRAALAERVGDLHDASSARTRPARPVTAACGPASSIRPSSTLNTSVESAPANAGLCALKRSRACWDSVPGMEKSSAASPPAPAAAPSSTMHDDGAGEAALPAMGQGAREPREQGRHGFSVMGGGTSDTVTRIRQTCKGCRFTRLATFCTILW